MPLYEYRCDACEHELEAQQKISDRPLRRCPRCGKHRLAKLISATSFRLKGGGWYQDLYASPKPGASDSGSPSKATSSPPAAPQGKGSGKSKAA